MASFETTPAAPWALLWLTGVTGVSWLALIASERFATGSPSTVAAPTPDPPQPARASVAAAADPAVTLPLQLGEPLSIGQGPLGTGLPADLPLPPTPLVSPLALQVPGWSTPPPSMGAAVRADSARHQASPPHRAASAGSPALAGSVLLGGPLDLRSLDEKAMVPAAMVERAQRLASPDRLQALPYHWRQHMGALLQQRQAEQVIPAEVVRLPVPNLSQPEEIPLAVRSDGADTTVEPASPRSKQALERWMDRQPTPSQGQVRPVVVVLEPIPAETPAVVSSSAPAAAAAPVAVDEAMAQPDASSAAPLPAPAPLPSS